MLSLIGYPQAKEDVINVINKSINNDRVYELKGSENVNSIIAYLIFKLIKTKTCFDVSIVKLSLMYFVLFLFMYPFEFVYFICNVLAF